MSVLVYDNPTLLKDPQATPKAYIRKTETDRTPPEFGTNSKQRDVTAQQKCLVPPCFKDVFMLFIV